MRSIVSLAMAALLFTNAASAAPQAAPHGAPQVFVVPNFHPASCGWLADFATERSYCAYSYLAHLDRVRADPSYRFALSEVNNQMAILAFEPARFRELQARVREGRVELANAFFLEPTINLSGGEALVRMGVEGLRWQQAVMGARPRLAWCIDVTGVHEQMPQIVAGLGLDGMVYTRDNPTGRTVHWLQAPDGTRALALSPGHYSDWGALFGSTTRLTDAEVAQLAADARAKAAYTPAGLPVLVLGGSGDYSLPPAYPGYPAEFVHQWAGAVPGGDVRFTGPGAYLDAILPAVRSGQVELPTSTSGAHPSWSSFWVQNPTVKGWYRRSEHGLQAAEMLATAASLRAGTPYPTQQLYQAWLLMLLNMDRNTLWGAAAGKVFESPTSWDARDRFQTIERTSARTQAAALRSLLGRGPGLGLFSPLNWPRTYPVRLRLPAGKRLAGTPCQAEPDGAALCEPSLPSLGCVGLRLEKGMPAQPQAVPLPERIETPFYSARIDPRSGALASLRTKPSGRELLAAPVLLAAEAGGDYHNTPVRSQRKRLADTGGPAAVTVSAGQVATVVEARGAFVGGKPCRQRITLYRRSPRVDFDVEVNDIPAGTVVVAEVPLAAPVREMRRGIPYGFSHGAVGAADPRMPGFTDGILPAVRWSHYTLADGRGLALLDRGLPGRELAGSTPVLFLLNAQADYMGYPCAWLSGKGVHRASFAILAHESAWSAARIPQAAWEFNAAPAVLDGTSVKAPASLVTTSANVIVEALRREGSDVELRMAECLGQAGAAEVRVALPHAGAALTDLTGAHPVPLGMRAAYRIPVRAQQIVTLRLHTGHAAPPVRPLLKWDALVPPAKLQTLRWRRPWLKGAPPPGPALSTADTPHLPADTPRSLALGRAARASNVYHSDAQYSAAMAVDGVAESRWATDDAVREASLEVDLGAERGIGRAYISEAYARVRRFALERLVGSRWEPFAAGGRIGPDLAMEFAPVRARRVRLHVLEATGGPTLWEFMLFAPRAALAPGQGR